MSHAKLKAVTIKRPAGFTLLELAIALVVIGALFATVLVPLATQVDVARMKETREQLEEIKEALIGFAVANDNRLPCPDTDTPPDGEENGPPCNDTEGEFPWATLGVGRQDGWGRPYRYRADDNYTTSSGVPDPPDTAGTIAIQDLSGNNLTVVLAANRPAAIVFSCGKNGVPDQENDADGTPNADANCSNIGTPDGTYMQNSYNEGQFDDQLMWLSKNTLVGRLAMTGVWPP